MGELKKLLQQISETTEEQQEKKLIQSIIDDITNQMVKNAKKKHFYWVANDKTRKYYQEIYEFFDSEGFIIDDYKTELRDTDGKIIQERSFNIVW